MKLYYSLSNIANILVNLIARHPLIIEAPVYHHSTKEQIKISYYRHGYGIPTKCGLSLAVYPAGIKTTTPNTVNTSVFIPDNEKEYVHFKVHFYWGEIALEDCHPCEAYAPASADICINDRLQNLDLSPNNLGITSNQEVPIQYFINPGFQIISDYLEILRFIFNDEEHLLNHSYFISEMQLLHLNYITSEWDKDANVYWHQGNAYIRMTTAMAKDWRTQCNIYPEFDPDSVNLYADKCFNLT